MPGVDDGSLPGSRVPNLDGVTVASRGDTRAVRGPRQVPHARRMAMVGEQEPSVLCIPDLDGAVVASRCDALAIRGPCQRIDGPSVACVEKLLLPGLCVTHLHGTLISPGSDSGAIRGPRHREDGTGMLMGGACVGLLAVVGERAGAVVQAATSRHKQAPIQQTCRLAASLACISVLLMITPPQGERDGRWPTVRDHRPL